jgi:hypothetical protein
MKNPNIKKNPKSQQNKDKSSKGTKEQIKKESNGKSKIAKFNID